jgi:hypothetical protein
MFKSFVYFLLFSGVICTSHDYDIHITKTNTIINNKEVFCFCGKSPDCIMFFSGRPEYYCTHHVPEIEHVKTIRPEDIQQLIAGLNQQSHNWNHQDPDALSSFNMNGAHQGITDGK